MCNKNVIACISGFTMGWGFTAEMRRANWMLSKSILAVCSHTDFHVVLGYRFNWVGSCEGGRATGPRDWRAVQRTTVLLQVRTTKATKAWESSANTPGLSSNRHINQPLPQDKSKINAPVLIASSLFVGAKPSHNKCLTIHVRALYFKNFKSAPKSCQGSSFLLGVWTTSQCEMLVCICWNFSKVGKTPYIRYTLLSFSLLGMYCRKFYQKKSKAQARWK